MTRTFLLVLVYGVVVSEVFGSNATDAAAAVPAAAKAAAAAAASAAAGQTKVQSPAIAYFAKALMDVPIGIIELCKDTAEGLEKMMITCVHGIFGNPKK